jgi:2-phosphosulfolactate phosphatase
MNLDVVLLPHDLKPGQLAKRATVVFDVLRATTSMTAALAAGVKAIHVFSDVDSVRAAKASAGDSVLMCGEVNCFAPPGFDLGNSPGQFTPASAARTVLMSTTNGTRAILAAKESKHLFAAALVNATATAKALAATGCDITLLCAGTGGNVAMEDLLGCGAVIDSLVSIGASPTLGGDVSRIALRLFRDNRLQLSELLRETDGGRNIIAAGLTPDIDFCARVDAFDIVAEITGDPPVVRRQA